MRFRRLFVVLSGVLAVAIAMPPASFASVRADQAVHGDDENDAFVGTGGLILPPSVDEGVRRAAAGCQDCSWRVTAPCARTDLGAPIDDTCHGVVRGCPGGALRRAWFQPADGPWRETGLFCLGAVAPWTVRQAGQAVGERLSRAVPGMAMATSPSRGILAQLPTYFATGMPAGPQAFDMTVAGHDIVVRAAPSWTWSFGDGSWVRTDDPGGAYPWPGVTHAFRVAGRYRVTCSVAWVAEFWSDGLGPFPVPETVRQEASLEVQVGEGRAVLIPGAAIPDGRGTMGGRPARPS